jgi:hypothetical protein
MCFTVLSHLSGIDASLSSFMVRAGSRLPRIQPECNTLIDWGSDTTRWTVAGRQGFKP